MKERGGREGKGRGNEGGGRRREEGERKGMRGEREEGKGGGERVRRVTRICIFTASFQDNKTILVK